MICCRQPESSIAPYLTSLSKRVANDGIHVGSYPQMGKGVYVSLIGEDHAKVREIAGEVEKELGGEIKNKDDTESTD